MIIPTRESFPSFGSWLEELARILETEDDQNLKKNRPITMPRGVAIILTDDNGVKWKVRVSTVGVLSTVAA